MSTPQALVWIPNEARQQLGGGWSFARNFVKAFAGSAVFDAQSPVGARILLIPGSTIVNTETVRIAKESGMKVVLRVDNIPRNSRNRNTGTSRLKELAKLADAVIFQSYWAQSYLVPFLQVTGPVIYNSVDTDIFNPEGPLFAAEGAPVYLYSRYSRDETKSWERAWYQYQMIQRNNRLALLLIVGRYSDEVVKYNFDFFMNERYEYLGVIDDPETMARIYRGCEQILATYYNDAFSNTYIEALCCGCGLLNADMSGGTPEILSILQSQGERYFSLDRMKDEYEMIFNSLLGG